MKLERSIAIVIVLLGLVSIFPFFVDAQGLVPCTGEVGDECQFCKLVDLLDNVVDWLVLVLGVIAAILIVVAGARMVASGGDTSAKEWSKRTIYNMIIGFVLVLAGWLLIDTVIKVLVSEDGEIPNFGPWNEIECVAQPRSQQYASKGLVAGGTISAECVEQPDGSYDCSEQIALCEDGGGEATRNDGTDPPTVDCYYPPSAYSGSCETLSNGPCSPENLEEYFGSRAEEASRICNKESGGAPVKSGSDRCCGSGSCSGAPSFSGGYFQVNILANDSLVPGCDMDSIFEPNCVAGQSCQTEGSCVQRNDNNVCIGWSCTINTGSSMYNTCMAGALDPSTNLQVAAQLFGSGGFRPWANSANDCSISY